MPAPSVSSACMTEPSLAWWTALRVKPTLRHSQSIMADASRYIRQGMTVDPLLRPGMFAAPQVGAHSLRQRAIECIVEIRTYILRGSHWQGERSAGGALRARGAVGREESQYRHLALANFFSSSRWISGPRAPSGFRVLGPDIRQDDKN